MIQKRIGEGVILPNEWQIIPQHVVHFYWKRSYLENGRKTSLRKKVGHGINSFYFTNNYPQRTRTRFLFLELTDLSSESPNNGSQILTGLQAPEQAGLNVDSWALQLLQIWRSDVGPSGWHLNKFTSKIWTCGLSNQIMLKGKMGECPWHPCFMLRLGRSRCHFLIIQMDLPYKYQSGSLEPLPSRFLKVIF